MALDVALEDAVAAAVAEAGQPRAVASRLVAWLRALSEGESSEEQDLSFYDNVIKAVGNAGAADAD